MENAEIQQNNWYEIPKRARARVCVRVRCTLFAGLVITVRVENESEFVSNTHHIVFFLTVQNLLCKLVELLLWTAHCQYCNSRSLLSLSSCMCIKLTSSLLSIDSRTTENWENKNTFNELTITITIQIHIESTRKCASFVSRSHTNGPKLFAPLF